MESKRERESAPVSQTPLRWNIQHQWDHLPRHSDERSAERFEQTVLSDPESLRAALVHESNERHRAECLARMQTEVVRLALDLLAREGRLCFVALMGGTKVEADFGVLQRKHLTVTGSTLRSRSIPQKAAIVAALREKVWPLWASGKLRTFTYRQFPLKDAADAHRLMESSQHIGKILLVP